MEGKEPGHHGCAEGSLPSSRHSLAPRPAAFRAEGGNSGPFAQIGLLNGEEGERNERASGTPETPPCPIFGRRFRTHRPWTLGRGRSSPLFSTSPPATCPLAMSSQHQSLKHLHWEAMCERGQNWEQPSLSTFIVLFTSIAIKVMAIFLST